MRRSILTLALILATAGAPALAADKTSGDQAVSSQSDGGQARPAAKKADKEHKVCTFEVSTGSSLPKRVCHAAPESGQAHQQATADGVSAQR